MSSWLNRDLPPVVVVAREATAMGLPAIAFQGRSGRTGPESYNTKPFPSYSRVYGELAARVTQTLLDHGTSALPPDVFISVLFTSAPYAKCPTADNFRYYLAHRLAKRAAKSNKYRHLCGYNRLPSEQRILTYHSVADGNCRVAIVTTNATTGKDVDAEVELKVHAIFKNLLSCLPKRMMLGSMVHG